MIPSLTNTTTDTPPPGEGTRYPATNEKNEHHVELPDGGSRGAVECVLVEVIGGLVYDESGAGAVLWVDEWCIEVEGGRVGSAGVVWSEGSLYLMIFDIVDACQELTTPFVGTRK